MVEKHSTWDIHDSSKIQTYMSCPRQYFYRYVLGWKVDKPSEHLIFGESWHLAMEHLLLNGYSNEAIATAFNILSDNYYQSFDPMTDDQRFPKVPGVGLLGLIEYVKKYSEDEKEHTVFTEIAGSVPTLKYRINFRIDSIIQRSDNLYMVREHKTASKFGRAWEDQWKLSIQIGTYLHVLYCLQKAEDVWGVQVNGAAFKKGKGKIGEVDFLRVPIRKNPEMMEDWLFTIEHWMERIANDFNRLSFCSERETIMSAFPKNPISCTDYFGCEYMDLCMAWANPLRNCYEPPVGMIVEYWNPANYEGAKKVFEL